MNKLFSKKIGFFACSLILCTNTLLANESTLRVSVVNTPGYSGLMDMLIKEFKKENNNINITFNASSAPHQEAKDGKADLVISHYGKSELKDFVLEGYGSWPVMLFANQSAIIGPKNDPAGIKGLSAKEAYKKLANSDVTFVTNYLKGAIYLDEYLQFLSDEKEALITKNSTVTAKSQTAKTAEKLNAYFIWGVFPFLRYQDKHNSQLDILVIDDPILQRVMSSTIVQSEKIKGTNEKLAKEFEDFLIRPSTQAKIAKFRSMGVDYQLWWPYAKHN